MSKKKVGTIEHVKELRNYVWDCRKIHANAIFEIIRETTIEDTVKTLTP